MDKNVFRRTYVSMANSSTNITSFPSSFPTSNPTTGYDLPQEVYIGIIIVMSAGAILVVVGGLNCVLQRKLLLLDSCSLFFSISFWCFLVVLLCFAGSCDFGYCCTDCLECSCATTTPGEKYTCTAPSCSQCVGYDTDECTIKPGDGCSTGRCLTSFEGFWCQGIASVHTTQSSAGHYKSTTSSGLSPFYVRFFVPIVVICWFIAQVANARIVSTAQAQSRGGSTYSSIVRWIENNFLKNFMIFFALNTLWNLFCDLASFGLHLLDRFRESEINYVLETEDNAGSAEQNLLRAKTNRVQTSPVVVAAHAVKLMEGESQADPRYAIATAVVSHTAN